ncbi:MAG: acetate--CoA ligase family protein [Candidatus Helarchaeota archaeon]
MKNKKYDRFKKFFEPKSIGFYGASRAFTRFGSFNLINLIIGGYEGKIYPIHPKFETIMGLKAYKSILDVDDEIDIVIYVAPIKVLVDSIMEEIGQKGVKNVICVSAGLDEIGDFETSKKLRRIIKKYDITLLGPNCIGLIVPKSKIFCTPMPIYHPPGNISIVSQSGSFASHIFLGLSHIPFRVARVLSVGNCLTVDMTDCLEVLEEDQETKFIALYIEGIRRGQEFLKVARRISIKKPIVAVQIGQSEAGFRAAQSHTAAISTPSDLFSNICRQAGIILVEDTIQMFNLLYAMSKQPLPKGPRVGIITVGGGPGTLIADLCEKFGLKVPLLSQTTQDILIDKYLPFTGSPKNPVDITFDSDFSNFFKYIPRLLLKSNEVDALIYYGIFSSDFWTQVIDNLPDSMKEDQIFIDDDMEQIRESMRVMMDQNLRNIKRLGVKYNIPIFFTGFNDRTDSSVRLARENDIPVFFPAEAARVLSKMWQYNKWKLNHPDDNSN